MSAWLLDYGVRLLVIGVAALLGARWLSEPVKRLALAAGMLNGALKTGASSPRLDEDLGCSEVREAARLFNHMAQQIENQFRAQSLLAAALSHDLRTPLTRMRLRLESFSQDDLMVQKCIQDLRSMHELIGQTLDLVQDPTGDQAAQFVDVFSMVQSVCDDLQELGHDIALSGKSVNAWAQPTALQRVLTNLIGNGLRYGQSVHVEVHERASQVLIWVDDCGPGIPLELLDKVFEPFFRIEGSRNRLTGGVGLGLHIARDLTRRQGGSLTLSNRPEGGLRAQLSLPTGSSISRRE